MIHWHRSMEYEAVIGLETHVQLKTKSKMWCGCANAFGSEPNTNVCPVCLGMPGVLPVANDEALRLTALAGLLLNCSIPRLAVFDRKNYFYPDVAKNYQVTQLAHPSTIAGYVDFEFEGRIQRVRITRAHLEEDVGKNSHFDRHSGVDFNRGGVPLLEIVSEPDITSPDMAYEYLNALKDILTYGGVSDCDMEKGMVRCDVNISVRPKGTTGLGAKRWNMRFPARSKSSAKVVALCNPPGVGTTLRASPRKCAPRKTRMITAIFRSPTSCPSGRPIAGWPKCNRAWWSFPWPASNVSFTTTNCLLVTRKSSRLPPSSPRTRRASPTG
jgi:GatB/GatE catalytic domain